MVHGFIAVLTMISRGTWPRLVFGAALLCAIVGAQAAELQIAGANSHGNSIYELTQSAGGLITGISALNTDAAAHGSFKSLVWVPNAATGTLDLIAADTNNKQIVRYSGPNYTTGVAIFTWHGLHQGPAEPEALAVDAAGDIFVVSSVCGADVKASVWVLPVNTQGNYGAPVLIDDTFNNVMTSSLADTLIAGTTTPLWNAGDLLVLVGDSFDPRVMVYSRQAIAGVSINPSKPLSGPTSTAVPLSKFAPLSAVPVGMDVWPADATHGTSLLITTTDGRILRFDTGSSVFAANFASGLGTGLENIKTGAAAGVEYAFVSQELSGYKGNIFQFGAPPASGSNTPLATVTKGVSNPIGLAVTSSGSAPAQSCVSPDPACTFFGGGLTLEISGPGSSNISGNILEQSCVVQSDPRVTVHGSTWSCNGQTLDVSTVCPGFPSTILPGSLCGHSGPTGAGFVVLKGTALGVDPVDNNTQIVAQSNINALLPGPLNQNCNPVSAYAWAPRPDLTTNEGTIVEDALTPYFIDLTGFCDQPGVIQRGASMTSFGLALNSATSGLPNGLPGYVDSKYSNLQATVNAASITPSVAVNLDTYINDSETAFNNGVAGSPNGFSCAAYWADYADSYVRANLTAFSSNLTAAGGNPNPAFEISGRLANLFLTIETRVAGLPANTTWPPTNVPACVTLSASPASVPSGTATTLSWTALGVPTGSSCTLSGGAFANQTEPATGSVSSGNLNTAGSPYTFDLVCPGTGTATSFDTATVKATAPTTAPVPNVVTLTQAAATAAITSAGLKVGTVTQQTSTTIPAGTVIRQTPAAGTPAPIGSSVNLIVSSGAKVPNVVGSTQAAATTTINNAGLVVGTISQQASTTVAIGRVISESPLAGTLASAGSVVNIVVSSGTTVPSVVGSTQAAATTAITSAGLKLGTLVQQTSTTIPAGNVISQTPAAGAAASGGSAVNLVVSSGTKVPNVVGFTQAAATTAIDNAGLVVGTVTQQASTTVAIGRVISESPLAGTLASAGSVVNIVVSSGITVPNVVGSTEEAATVAITSVGLKLGRVTQQSSTTIPVGSVISQTPAGGAAASGGSAVNIILSSGTKVPNVVGSTQAAATTTIDNAGLVIGTITQQASTTVPNGTVISESPPANTFVNGGSAVNLVVSGGTAVPNVVGDTQAAATTSIQSAGLVLGMVTQQSSTTVPIGNVISESPLAATIVNPGSAVNIVISSGPPPAITSFGSSPTSYTTGSEALLNWTTTGEQSGDTCTLSATDGTYTTPTAVPANGAVYTGAFTTAGTYTATLNCPNVAAPATLNLTISVPVPMYNLNALAISPTNQNLYATNQAGDLSFEGPGGQVLVYTPSPFGMIQQPAQTIGPALNATTNLQYPSALAFDAAGNLYVADGGSDQIFVLSLSPTGAATLLNTITVPPLTQGDESYNCEPVGLAVDGQGYLYVSCNGGYIGSAIYVYQNLNSSTPLVSWTGDTNDAFFSNLYGVALDGQSLLVGLSYDYEESQVVSYKLTDLQSVANNAAGGTTALPAGVTIQPPPNNDPNPSGSSPAQVNIAVDSSANIYIASTYVDYAQSGIPYYPYTVASYSPIVYDPTTGAPSGATQTNPTTPTASTYLQPVPTLQGAAAPSPLLTGPDGIALDVSGNLYVVDPMNSTIDVYGASSGNYEYDFLPLITLTTTPVGEEGQYTLSWTSIGIEPSNASCLLTTSDGQYNATPEPTQNTTGVTLGSNYVTATLSCPGAIAFSYEYQGE
jgi:beta-lactam-binding protein with PASTA domain/sugar lactone lactonase YvrE